MSAGLAPQTEAPFWPIARACPNCEGDGLFGFARVPDIPVHNSLVLATAEEARNFPRGDLELAFCRRCAFITNTAFDLGRIRYDPTYEDQQSFSPTFNAFAQRIAGDLVERYDIRGKDVVEVGCGKGDFLALVCEFGANRGVGIDPTALPGRLGGQPGAERVTLVAEHYGERHARYPADLVMCRHTLEHVPDPLAFLRTVRRAIGAREGTVVFLEVPDTLRVLRETAYWDMYYEHCSYFTPGSFARLARAAGFTVLRNRLDFDEQYLLLEARPGASRDEAAEPRDDVAQTESLVLAYAASLARQLERWRAHFAMLHDAGKRVAVWGSGSKCVAFLTTLGPGVPIERVVDINPHRHGKFIPGAGLEIAAPSSLVAYRPDEVVVMNPIYLDEIRAMLRALDVHAEVVAV